MSGNPRNQGIGHEMKAARKAAEIDQATMAATLGITASALSKYENGRLRIKPSVLTRYLLECGSTPDLIAELVEASSKPDEPQWLAVDVLDRKRQQAALLALEGEATTIYSLSPLLFSGMLQTSEYTRAIMRDSNVPADEIESRVALRRGRQAAITDRGVDFFSFTSEATLRGGIGGVGVMVRQLRYIQEQMARPNVCVQVIPSFSQYATHHEGPFTYFEFGDGGRTPVVHSENVISGLFCYDASEVEVYWENLQQVRKIAMSPAASAELIADVITELSTQESETA